MTDANTIYIGIGVATVAAGAGAFGRNVVDKVFTKRNGNGKTANGKFDHKRCLSLHKDIDLSIKGLQDNCEVFVNRLDQGSTDFKEIKKSIHEIDKNVGVLLDRSDNGKRNRRSTD